MPRRATVTDSELERLAIFPLPEVVLFPNTLVPLHVFEPRYSRLVGNCIEQDLPLAVWQVDPGARETRFGPGIRSVATVGTIAMHHELPDGRFDIVVEGLERVRLVEELESAELYRTVRSERHPLVAPDEALVAARLDTIREISRALVPAHPRAARLVMITLERLSCPREMSDVLCSLSFEEGPVRQLLLEQSSITARLDRVIDALATLVVREPSADDGSEPS